MTADGRDREVGGLEGGRAKRRPARPRRRSSSGVPRTLPALLRAYELSARAAAVGFDWVAAADVLDKIDEEVAELKDGARHSPQPRRASKKRWAICCSRSRTWPGSSGVEPEAALRVANDKFQRRFEGMERSVMQTGRSLRELTLAELERAWTVQKQIEGANGHDPSR